MLGAGAGACVVAGACAGAAEVPGDSVTASVAQQTDALEITSESLGPAFPHGMLAMMSNRGAFHFYKWEDVQAAIDKVRARTAAK
ncbi:MAG: hypothetical protein ABJB74_05305 [Gemmatimonas sp.]